MLGSLQAISAVVARLIIVNAVGSCLLLSGIQVHASGNSLNLAVSDVFSVTRADLGFTDDPDVLRLAQASTESETRKAWEAALPPADKFDWVQTTSGEWLKGDLKALYTGSLEFNSDEFGLQTIDWDDVAQFRDHGTKRLSIESPDGPISVDGLVNVTKNMVVVVTDGETREFNRSQLISMTPGGTKETNNWSAKISFGLVFFAREHGPNRLHGEGKHYALDTGESLRGRLSW